MTTATTATAPQTAVSTWAIDPAHSVAEFKVKHMMISNVKGQFLGVSGTLERHEGDVTKSKVEVTIDAASVNTRDAQRDAHLKSADFFEVEKFPTLSFKSTRIILKNQDDHAVEGELTIHGVTKEVVLDVEGPSAPMNAMGGMRMGAEATTKINRQDFGVSGAPGAVGDEIQITLDVEVTRPASK